MDVLLESNAAEIGACLDIWQKKIPASFPPICACNRSPRKLSIFPTGQPMVVVTRRDQLQLIAETGMNALGD